MLRDAMLMACGAMPWYVTRCYDTLCYATSCVAMQWYAMLYYREFPQKTKIRNLRRTRIFREKFFRPFFRVPCTLSFCQKSEKTNEGILHKVQKTLFLGSFWPKFAQKKFFSKIGLRHILGIAILHLCAKNQQKLMSQSREKLVTNERTDGRTNERT